MIDMFGPGRIATLFAIAANIAGAAMEVTKVVEPRFLNIPLSGLYIAIGGALIGVFLLPNPESSKPPMPADTSWSRRLFYLAITAGALGAAVLAYAIVAAWAVQFMAGFFSLKEAVVLSSYGLMGVMIRPLLPGIVKSVDKRAAKILGGD